MNKYLNGDKLFGDDFNISQILEWYKDEEEGYSNLGAKDKDCYTYGYHALNKSHGFDFLSSDNFQNVLGFGSAYGDEFTPILNQIQQITILEPSDVFKNTSIRGIPVKYVKPSPDGSIPFENNTFDLITCFGVLHHIPNVSKVLSELYRVLKPNGYLLV